jgi:hypothetical protein
MPGTFRNVWTTGPQHECADCGEIVYGFTGIQGHQCKARELEAAHLEIERLRATALRILDEWHTALPAPQWAAYLERKRGILGEDGQ